MMKKQKKRKLYKARSYHYTPKPNFLLGELSGLKGQFKPNLVPEVRLSYTKGKRVLGSVKSSEDVATFLRKQYKRGAIETQEFFNTLFLDRKNSILGFYQHSKGSISATIADPRLVFAIALKSLASSIILSHNHPSGQLKPSDADKRLTQQFVQLGKIHDIQVLDHVIVTKDSYYSFADEGML